MPDAPTEQLTGYRVGSGAVTLPLPGSTLEAPPPDAEEVRFSGRGRIVTYTVVTVASPRFRPKVPYALGVIELAEGARLLAMIDGGTPENLSVDASVQYKRKDEYGYHFELV